MNIADLHGEPRVADDPLLEELMFHFLMPMSPYAIDRADRQVAAGWGCIYWDGPTTARHQMLEEWWCENEPDLSAEVRGQFPRRRLERSSSESVADVCPVC